MRRHDKSEWTERSGVGSTAEVDPLRHLARIAHRDVLTNLPNRFLLADRVRQALYQCQRRGQALALAYLCLNGFTTIKATHGPAVGDELLVSVSLRMKESMREGDTLARIGGDAFVAVLVDLDAHQDGEPVLDRLLQVARNPVTVGDVLLQVSASRGVTLYPEGTEDVDMLLRHADQAQYQAMGKHRHQLFDLDLNQS